MLKSMVVLAGGIALASLCAAQASAADVFTISSKTFKDGSMLPKAASNKNANNPNCVGENVSPELSWVNPPAGTKSYVLLMEDPEGRAPAAILGQCVTNSSATLFQT